jgi:hypothetical protein
MDQDNTVSILELYQNFLANFKKVIQYIFETITIFIFDTLYSFFKNILTKFIDFLIDDVYKSYKAKNEEKEKEKENDGNKK